MDYIKIDAALSATSPVPSDDLVVSLHPYAAYPFFRDTGLTVAELREILEAARGQAWRDASDPPNHGLDVLVTNDAGRYWVDRWSFDTWVLSSPGDIRRWRELPR